jgi:hypothetical protein
MKNALNESCREKKKAHFYAQGIFFCTFSGFRDNSAKRILFNLDAAPKLTVTNAHFITF